jgi:hypothetical protein
MASPQHLLTEDPQLPYAATNKRRRTHDDIAPAACGACGHLLITPRHYYYISLTLRQLLRTTATTTKEFEIIDLMVSRSFWCW